MRVEGSRLVVPKKERKKKSGKSGQVGAEE